MTGKKKVRTDIFLSSIFLSWLSDESINSETGRVPARGGRGRNIDGKKMENTGSAFSCHQFSCLEFLAQYTTTNTST